MSKRASFSRGLTFSAVGALIGLGLAGYGLFTAKGTQTATVPPEDIALVNNKPILVADYIVQMRTLFNVAPAGATAAQKRKVLHDMIREELFVQRGLEIDEASVDPDVRAALVNAVDQQVAADVLSGPATEDQLKRFYEQHKDKYSKEGTMTVHDLVAGDGATPATLRDAAQALRQGLSLPAALHRFGVKESGKVDGEEFYFAAKIHLGDRLFAIARALEDGGVSDPVEESGVPHVLVMEKNKPPVALSFQQTRSEALGDYQQERAKRAQAGEEDFLYKRATIQIAPGYAP